MTVDIEGTNRRLMFHGMCLFVLGLLTGFAEQHFANVCAWGLRRIWKD